MAQVALPQETLLSLPLLCCGQVDDAFAVDARLTELQLDLSEAEFEALLIAAAHDRSWGRPLLLLRRISRELTTLSQVRSAKSPSRWLFRREPAGQVWRPALLATSETSVLKAGMPAGGQCRQSAAALKSKAPKAVQPPGQLVFRLVTAVNACATDAGPRSTVHLGFSSPSR